MTTFIAFLAMVVFFGTACDFGIDIATKRDAMVFAPLYAFCVVGTVVMFRIWTQRFFGFDIAELIGF